MSTNTETKTVVPPQAETTKTAETKTQPKTEQKTGLAKYKKFFYFFFVSSAGLIVSYFTYRRFQKKH